jgi:hypothetical protein
MENTQRTSSEVTIGQLTRAELLRLFWGVVWRNWVMTLSALVLTFIVAFIVGAVLGLIVTASGQSIDELKLLFQAIGFAIGLAMTTIFILFWLLWILRSRYGTVRIALMRDTTQDEMVPSEPHSPTPTPTSTL